MISNSRPSSIAVILVCLVALMAASFFVPFASASRMLQGTPLPTGITRTPAARDSSAVTPLAATRTPEITGGVVPPGQVYTVQAGDTLWSIATKFYGNGTKYPVIQRANNLPENSIIQIGSILTIPPFPEVTPIPPSRTVEAVLFTPSPTLAPELPTSVALPSLESPPLPTSLPVVSVPPNSDSKLLDASWAPLVPYLVLLTNVLSGLCFLGSLVCVYLALESYRHSRPYVKRRRIGNRVRDGL